MQFSGVYSTDILLHRHVTVFHRLQRWIEWGSSLLSQNQRGGSSYACEDWMDGSTRVRSLQLDISRLPSYEHSCASFDQMSLRRSWSSLDDSSRRVSHQCEFVGGSLSSRFAQIACHRERRLVGCRRQRVSRLCGFEDG